MIYLALPLYHMSGSLLGIVGCLGIGQSPSHIPLAQGSPTFLMLCPLIQFHLSW